MRTAKIFPNFSPNNEDHSLSFVLCNCMIEPLGSAITHMSELISLLPESLSYYPSSFPRITDKTSTFSEIQFIFVSIINSGFFFVHYPQKKWLLIHESKKEILRCSKGKQKIHVCWNFVYGAWKRLLWYTLLRKKGQTCKMFLNR